MKICHVTTAHNRYDGRIFLKQCSSLAKNGYDVTLLCCDELDDEIKNNVNIISLKHKYNSVYDRIFSSKKELKKKCVEIDADIYQFHDPDLLSVCLYMKKCGKKVIFDSHEDYPALFLEREWIPNFLRKTLSSIYEKKEKNVFKKIDFIICVADYQKTRIEKINKNVEIITNYPIVDNTKIKDVNDNKKTTICFAGGVRADWNHDTVIKAIEDIDSVNYIIAGKYKQDYFEKLKSIDLNNKVSFLGKINYEEVKQLYKKSDIAVALCSYRPNTGYTNGSLGITKIFEYMMYGLPVVFTDFKVFKDILKEGKFGFAVNPYSCEEVQTAINYLINHKEEAYNMGKTGQKLVLEKYNWDTQVPVLLSIYSKVGSSDDR